MKDEFLKKLEENEELLFYGISSVKKTSKQLLRMIICIIVLSLLTVCLI